MIDLVKPVHSPPKKMKYYVCLICIIFLTTITPGNGLANHPLIIQLELSEPWAYNSKDRQIIGIWIDFLKEITKSTNYHFQISLKPYARVVRNLEQGLADLSFLPVKNASNQKRKNLTYLFDYRSVILPQKNIIVRNYLDLMGLRLGLVRGTEHHGHLDTDPSLLKQYFRNQEILLLMLNKNRLDALVGNYISFEYLIKKGNFASHVGDTYLLQKVPIWLQSSTISDHNSEINVIKVATEALKANGVLANIINIYKAK